MRLTKTHFPFVIAFLSTTIAARPSLSTEPVTVHFHPNLWPIVLREFLFKAITSPRNPDDELYKKLLRATFYGDPSSIASNARNSVISRGNVYKTVDGRWILCQEGCQKCEICDDPMNDSTVKWILRRSKRSGSLGPPKWNLRLTVVPQMGDAGFHIGKHPVRYKHVYVIDQDGAGAEIVREVVPSTLQPEIFFGNTGEANSWGPNRAKRYSDIDSLKFEEARDYHPDLSEPDSYRSKRRSASTYRESESPVEKFHGDENLRLIVGIDQHGKKHLIHLLPIHSPSRGLDRSDKYSPHHRSSPDSDNAARIGRTIRQDADASPTYNDLIERILDSFDDHRNFIEKFLFSDRLVPSNSNGVDFSSYANYPGSRDEMSGPRNLEGYRNGGSGGVDPYSTGQGYHLEERNEQFRRYPDVTQEVNKPSGEYQDQNTMIEYDPYGGASAEDHHQQRRGKTSLAVADVDRKRHNFFAELTDSTVGHQTPAQYHNRTDVSDAGFNVERDYMESLSKQGLADLPIKINATDARNFLEVSAATDIQTSERKLI